MTARTPTAEQEAIVDAFGFGGDLVIEAGAGTGKTSTLEMIAASSRERGVYLAYNRAIADEAKRRFPRQVTAKTAHSFAYQMLGKRMEHRLSAPRMTGRDTARILGITKPVQLVADRAPLAPTKLARLVMETVTRFCYSADELPTAQHVPAVPGLEAPLVRAELGRYLVPLAVKAWETDLTQPDGCLQYAHDHYLKAWCLTRPQLGAEYVLLDEAQDSNPAVAALVLDQQAQRVMVGDRCQSIYGWRGAVDAMSTFDGHRLYLSQSWRFGPQIAAEANKWLLLLDAQLRLTGNPGIASTVGPLEVPDAVLCRTNAGAVAAAVAAMDAGRTAALVGGGQDIRRLAEAAITLKQGLGTDHPELMAFTSWGEVQAYVEEDAAGADLAVFVRLIDTYTAPKIIAIVDRLASEDQADVVMSTAHKAKGREWATVQIADDFGEPTDDTDGLPGPIPREDAMLAYVAVTRAKVGLDRAGLVWVQRHLAWAETGRAEVEAYGAELAAAHTSRLTVAADPEPVEWSTTPCPRCGGGWRRGDVGGPCQHCGTPWPAPEPAPPAVVSCRRCGSTACTCDPVARARWEQRLAGARAG